MNERVNDPDHICSDGTLITQRFHFAPMPQPHRHVLGWYRMLEELKECGVSAICVFDGKERSLAKQLEVRYFFLKGRVCS